MNRGDGRFSPLMYSAVFPYQAGTTLCNSSLLWAGGKLPHDRLHFNAFKVSEFNIKNEKCAGRFYLMGICPLCFLVKISASRMRFGKG